MSQRDQIATHLQNCSVVGDFPSETSKAERSKSERPDVQVSVKDVCDNYYLCWCSGIRVVFKSDCVVISLISCYKVSISISKRTNHIVL